MATCNYYPKFEANQVLTAEQLNQLICYLDKQEKLTRSMLIGVGIVCGFEVELVKSPSIAIKISKGCGITTEGYLIALNKYKTEKTVSNWHTFTKYRSYKDPSKYSLFGDENSQLSLWELLYDDFEDENSTIEKLTSKFLEDQAVILFLEKREVDLATCTGDDCNEKGIRVELCVRVLLINLKDLETILKQCSQSKISKSYKYEIEGKFKLPELSIEREYSLNESNDFYDYNDLEKLYGKIFVNTIKELPEVLVNTYELFYPLLREAYAENPFKKLDIEKVLKSFIDQNKFGYQYCYDYLKDMIITYNEFRASIFDLTAACCFDAACFPRHLMLGEAVPTGKCIPSVYRNTFSPSPIYNGQKELQEKTLMLFKRIVRMTETFGLPEDKAVGIRITPSKELVELGERAIPYYYFVKNAGINGVWNYDLIRKCRPYYNLSYYSKNYPEGFAPDYIIKPLKYNIQNYDFFRIEGYLGLKCNTVMEFLLKIISMYNLPIKVIRLQLGKEPTGEGKLPDCRFQDLELLYSTLRTEFLCLLKNELKFFGQLDYGYSEKEVTTYGGLSVKVVESQKGSVVPGATIGLKSSGGKSETIGGITNINGVYLAKKIPTGSYTLSVTLSGYTSSTEEITIEEALSKLITISLDKATSKAVSEKYDERKSGGFGFEFSGGTGFSERGELVRNAGKYVYSDMSVGNIYLGYLESGINDMLGYYGSIFGSKGSGSQGAEDFINKYYYPLQIVKIIEEIASTVPSDMQNFNYEFLSSKADSLSEILDTFSDQINANLKDEKYEQTGTESEILIHLDELSKMCNLKNFKEIISIYKKRALEIQKLTLFNNFIKKYNGIEHKAGVEKGGTFILVCDENDFAVADFALPYICCSDCPPITYVLADQPVIFKLSKTTFCANDNSNYIIINEPTGGVVTGSGVTQDSATGQYYFNPFTAGAGQIKLTYNFNLQNYELLVNVIEIKPNFTYALAKAEPHSQTRKVSFAALPDSADSYTWDFGDGTGTSTVQKPTYTFNVSDKQTFDVKLVVKKGECSGTTIQTITIPTCTAEFTYKIVKIVDNVAVVQFDSEMKDGDKYEWDFGDEQTYSGEDPLHSFDVSKINSFKVTLNVAKGDCTDSSEQNLIINICTADFTSEIYNTTYNKADVLFKAKTTDANTYNWNFGDGTTSGSINSSEIKHTYLLKSEQQTVNVVLSMQKDICSSTVTNKIILPPSQEVTISLDKNEFCKKDESSYKFKLSVTGGEVVGKGVTKQNNDFYFTPSSSLVSAGTITFTYKLTDGTSKEYSVKVYNPVASFKAAKPIPSGSLTQLSYIVEVVNSSQNAEKYIWELNSVIVSKELNPRIIITNAKPGAQYELRLTASFQTCNDTAKELIVIPATPTDIGNNISVVTTGGNTTVYTPTDSGTVTNNQPHIAFTTNVAMVNNLTSNSLFGNSLTANVVAYKDTKTYFTAVNEELSNSTILKLYVSGNKNDEIAEKFSSLINSTVTRIMNYTGTDAKEQQQFAYNLILLQVSQLFNLLSLQKTDITAGSSIANLFPTFYKQLLILKEIGIDLNPEGKFKEILSSAAANSADKPLLLTYLERFMAFSGG